MLGDVASEKDPLERLKCLPRGVILFYVFLHGEKAYFRVGKIHTYKYYSKLWR